MPRGRVERMRRALDISVQTTANSSAVNDLINFAAPSDRIPAVANDGSDFPRKSNENFKPFPFAGKIRCKKAAGWGRKTNSPPSLTPLAFQRNCGFRGMFIKYQRCWFMPCPFPSKRTEIFRPLLPRGADIIRVRRSAYQVFRD